MKFAGHDLEEVFEEDVQLQSSFVRRLKKYDIGTRIEITLRKDAELSTDFYPLLFYHKGVANLPGIRVSGYIVEGTDKWNDLYITLAWLWNDEKDKAVSAGDISGIRIYEESILSCKVIRQ